MLSKQLCNILCVFHFGVFFSFFVLFVFICPCALNMVLLYFLYSVASIVCDIEVSFDRIYFVFLTIFCVFFNVFFKISSHFEEFVCVSGHCRPVQCFQLHRSILKLMLENVVFRCQISIKMTWFSRNDRTKHEIDLFVRFLLFQRCVKLNFCVILSSMFVD